MGGLRDMVAYSRCLFNEVECVARTQGYPNCQPRVLIWWQPPEHGWFKANVDGHATECVVTRPRRPRVSRGLDLSGMLSDSVFCLFGLEYRYSSVVSVPEFNTGIHVSVMLDEYRYPFEIILVSIHGKEYRYPSPLLELEYRSLKHDSLCLGP
ncbi:hypothetical protein GQ457_13G012440 [Hibiscus cannabinus]